MVAGQGEFASKFCTFILTVTALLLPLSKYQTVSPRICNSKTGLNGIPFGTKSDNKSGESRFSTAALQQHLLVTTSRANTSFKKQECSIWVERSDCLQAGMTRWTGCRIELKATRACKQAQSVALNKLCCASISLSVN